ncbi:MAG TPA: choice-of-anchor J domain-containing protein [Flavobacteriales bacterium]|nr:choice-of-anchor J domain-containing protein [Flavobacteriales bacterium]
MKKILLIVTIFTSLNCVNAQVVSLLTENFNAGFPATWMRVNNDGLTPQAIVSFVDNAWVAYEDIDSTGTGDSVAVATSYYSPAGTANDWMISPAIALEHHGNFLRWEVQSQDASYPDGYDVMISYYPVVDSFYVDTVFAVDAEYADWTTRTVSLDDFVNQTIYIAFRAKSTNKFLLLIDNIQVYADTTISVSEVAVEETKLQAFPNPATDFVNVYAQKNIAKAVLYDMAGKETITVQPHSSKFQVSMQGINAGVYILYVYCTDGTTGRVKIIRQ